MKKFMAMKAVYSYRFPEIRKIVTELANPFPHDVYLKSASMEGGLDSFHESIIEKIIKFYSGYTPSLKDFGFRYPTSGSEEGIREIMTLLQGSGVRKIYTFRGEYEGYKEVGRTRNIETAEIDIDADPCRLEPGLWFISNPSAIDGNIIPNNIIKRICGAGHKIFYDLAYLGSTRKHRFDLSNENIFAAVLSFSKPYGLFYDRIGFAFSRMEIPSLYANKWFKNIFGLMVAEKIVSEMKPDDLYKKYSPVQKSIVKAINNDFGFGMRCSDALLLGCLKDADIPKLDRRQLGVIAPFRRGSGCRFCLTPYYQMLEKS